MNFPMFLGQVFLFSVIGFATFSERNGRFLWSWNRPGGENVGFPGTLPNYFSSYPSDCPTTDGNRTGICVSNSYECRKRGGRVLGTCYKPAQGGIQGQIGQGQQGFGNNFNPGIPVGVCCFYQLSCGGTALYNGTYFRNPNAPGPNTDSNACTITIPKLRPDICQIRLDFYRFDIERPENGRCNRDRFVVSGQEQNNVIPPICGINHGQHVYIELGQSRGPVSLNVLTTGNGNRYFDIRITQIPCFSPYRAPDNCLQYHYGLIGQIRSFNFQENNNTGRYFTDLDYTICFKKHPGYCTITYRIPDIRFQNNAPATVGTFFDIEYVNQNDMSGIGPLQCPNDYLILANTRLCGTQLNADVTGTSNAEVYDNTTGPIFARFVSNSQDNRKGFLLDYRLNPCFIGG